MNQADSSIINKGKGRWAYIGVPPNSLASIIFGNIL